MNIAELIEILQMFEDDQTPIIINMPKEYREIDDVEEWGAHAEITVGPEVDTGCEKCEGYGIIYSHIPGPRGGPADNYQPIEHEETCEDCEGRGYFNIQEHFERKMK